MGKLSLTKLTKIHSESGDVFHIYKDINTPIKEVYLSSVYGGKVKGWKKHKRMTLNITVISGNINFYIMSDDFKFKEQICIGDSNYARLTIPPNFWVAFSGLDASNSLINVADFSHDPEEFETKTLDEFNEIWKLS